MSENKTKIKKKATLLIVANGLTISKKIVPDVDTLDCNFTAFNEVGSVLLGILNSQKSNTELNVKYTCKDDDKDIVKKIEICDV